MSGSSIERILIGHHGKHNTLERTVSFGCSDFVSQVNIFGRPFHLYSTSHELEVEPSCEWNGYKYDHATWECIEFFIHMK